MCYLYRPVLSVAFQSCLINAFQTTDNKLAISLSNVWIASDATEMPRIEQRLLKNIYKRYFFKYIYEYRDFSK